MLHPAIGALAVGFLVMSSAAFAADDMDIKAIANQARTIQENALKKGAPEWLRMPSGPAEINPLTGGPMEKQAVPKMGQQIEILVSMSLGEPFIKDLFAEMAGRRDITIIFRGIPKDAEIGKAVKHLHALMKDLDPPPNVVIDPTRFTALNATTVPEIAVLKDGKLIAKARGISSPTSMLSRIERGERGDLGVLGPTAVPSEPDLIQVMQARVRQLDLSGTKKRALESYWDRAQFLDLPAALQDRERTVDPSVIVTNDIVLPNGQTLAHAGDKINPLERVPFTQQLVIFDATDKSQSALAERLVAESGGKRRVTLITTKLQREDGWEGLKNLENRLRTPVYLLTPEIKERFEIQRVPSTVEARGPVFVVKEFAVKKGIAK